jgi:methylenetetrahydrofolate--tRNA-(uracil-5-)-methyltransferase
MKAPTINIIGGGLAGSEAAYQCAKRGLQVRLYEMRPHVMTPAHTTGNLAELVCSNSFKSTNPDSAPGLLKHEMEQFDSLILKAAVHAQVAAGQALAVDRVKLSEYVTRTLTSFDNFALIDQEVTELPDLEELLRSNEAWIVATGPLTSEKLSKALAKFSMGEENLFFYDAIAPILEADSIDMTKGFWASRYDKGDGQDYYNIPLDKNQYETLIDDIINAEKMPLHEFEKTPYFEACLPVEVMIERGRETLRFGPMKPVGLTDPNTGRWPYAAIQLRKENEHGTMLSMVGFQTKMKWPEQKRIFSKLPGLENVEFFRLGSVHRNTYFNSPKVLSKNLSFNTCPRVFLAGQITGVEGYTESSAMGILAGLAAFAEVTGTSFTLPPRSTMMGALAHYVTQGSKGEFQPMNANMGLLPNIGATGSKKDRHALICEVARTNYAHYFGKIITGLREIHGNR